MDCHVSLLVCDCVESDISLHIPVLSTQGSKNQQECLVHPNNHTMYGCFGSASGYENNALDNGGQRHGRSRSPPNRANTGGVSAAAPWTSGNPKLDELFYKKVQDPEILRQFSEIEVYKRKNIMLNMEEKKIEDPTAWIARCVKNHQMNAREQAITGQIGARPGAARGSRFGVPNQQSGFGGNSRPGMGESHSNASQSSQQSSAMRRQDDAVPHWCRDVRKLWPDKKSQLCGEIFKMFNKSVMEKVDALDIPAQAALAFAVILAAPSSQDGLNEMVSQWMNREAVITSSPRAGVAESATPVHSEGLTIQMIISGGASAHSACLFHVLKTLLETASHSSQITLLSPIILASNEAEKQAVLQVEQGLPKCRESAEEVRDWLQLENWFEKSSVELVDKNHKIFMVNMLGFKSVFDELEQDELDAALHTSECRWMFEAVKMSGRLRHLLGDQNVGEITFASPVFNERTREELQCLCGSLINVPEMPAHDLIKDPLMFCFPSGCTWNDASDETQLPVDSKLDVWSIHDKVYKMTDLPHAVATKLGNMRTTALFKERVLSKPEKDMFQKLTMQCDLTGETVMLNRQFWMKQYGLNKTPMDGYYKKNLPCEENINTTTGKKTVTSQGSKCGTKRYCENCAKTMEILDENFRLPVLVNGSLNVLFKCVSLWRQKDAGSAWTRPAHDLRDHECSTLCPRNPRP